MNNDDFTLADVNTCRGGENPPSIGFTSVASPILGDLVIKDSQNEVSTKNALSVTASKYISRNSTNVSHWYVLRTTYGREKKAYDYMVAKGIKAFYPTQTIVKQVRGKRTSVAVSRLPNIFFAFGTEEQIKAFVYDNVHLPFLRFYYRHTHGEHGIERTPLIVPTYQMESLRIICEAEASNTIVSLKNIPKFQSGQPVRVVDGAFKGVKGRVARWQGQQRVAVIVEELVTMITAYVPSAFLEPIK